jgi:hypothetical protein
VNLPKYFSHPSLIIYFFCNPAHQTETRTADRLELGTNSKPPGPFIMIGQSKTREQQSDHIYYTLLYQVHSFAAVFTSLSKLSKYVGEKPIS